MSYTPLIIIGQNDTLPVTSAVLTDDNTNIIVNLTTATSVQFIASNVLLGHTIGGAATITNAAAGAVTYNWVLSDTQVPGVYAVEWLVTWNTAATSTYPLHGYDLLTIVKHL
jgi:hypothetical protein